MRILLGRHSGVFRNQPTGAAKKFFPRRRKFFSRPFFAPSLLFLQQSVTIPPFLYILSSFSSFFPPASTATRTRGAVRVEIGMGARGHGAPCPPLKRWLRPLITTMTIQYDVRLVDNQLTFKSLRRGEQGGGCTFHLHFIAMQVLGTGIQSVN
jgi:hypothetical protein